MQKWLIGTVIAVGAAIVVWFSWERGDRSDTDGPGQSAVIEQPSGNIIASTDEDTAEASTAPKGAAADAGAGSGQDEAASPAEDASASESATPEAPGAGQAATGDAERATSSPGEEPASALDAARQPEPGPDATDQALQQPAEPAAPIPPSFDVVRVDRDGQMVLAGKAAPGDVVQILLDGDVIAETVADAQGGFVAVVLAELDGETAQQLQLRVALPESGGASDGDQVVAAPDSEGAPASQAPLPLSSQPQPASSADLALGQTQRQTTEPATSDQDAADAPAEEAANKEVAAGPAASSEGVATLEPALAPAPVGSLSEPAQAPSADDGVIVQRSGGPSENTAQAAAPDASPSGAARLQTDRLRPVESAPAGQPKFALSAPVIILPSSGDNGAPTLVTPQQQELAILQPGGPPARGVVLDRITYGETGDVRFQGRGQAGRSVRIYGNAAALGTARIAENGGWRWSMSRQLAEPIKLFRFDELADDGSVTSRIETPFQYSSLSPQVLKERRVVIQRGDVLWRIAEQYYGEGIRYSAIYGANAELIRDPDLIYPGQIFSIPELVDAN